MLMNNWIVKLIIIVAVVGLNKENNFLNLGLFLCFFKIFKFKIINKIVGRLKIK